MLPSGYGPVNSKPENFYKAALFLQSGLLSTLIRRENGVLRKRSSNWRNLKASALYFRVQEKNENKAFEFSIFKKDDKATKFCIFFLYSIVS